MSRRPKIYYTETHESRHRLSGSLIDKQCFMPLFRKPSGVGLLARSIALLNHDARTKALGKTAMRSPASMCCLRPEYSKERMALLDEHCPGAFEAAGYCSWISSPASSRLRLWEHQPSRPAAFAL